MITLRPYQEEAINSIFKYWQKTANRGNPVVVMPVGSGKSPTMAGFIKRCYDKFGTRMSKVLVITHVKELIEQDYEAIVDFWPGAPLGVYSASLNKKQTDNRIICCGVQSIAKPETYKKFGKVNCLVIDECHLVPAKEETTYRRLIAGLKEINPKLKVVGFTGTPFRLDCGWITENGIFDDIVYNMCTVETFDWLIRNNYMCDAIPRRPEFQIDVSNVKIRGGEYVEKELQQAVDTDAVTRAALNETIQLAKDRKHWLIFCTGVEHAKHVVEYLCKAGINSTVISGDLDMTTRRERIDGFKSGKYRAVANVNVLSTGFNYPDIDCLVMLRPTQSVSLYIQACGRGIRYSPNKENCLILDFAGNVARLGCINDPLQPKKKTGKKRDDGEGTAPVKVCPKCNCYAPASAKFCPACNYEFPTETKLTAHASLDEIIKRKQKQETEKTVEVTHVKYAKIQTKNGVQVLVEYRSGIQTVAKDWINIESEKSFFATAAKEWIRIRSRDGYIPKNTQELLVMCLSGKMREPKAITVKTSGGYNRIVSYDFDGSTISGNATGHSRT